MSEWISVKDRLPKRKKGDAHSEPVLVCAKYQHADWTQGFFTVGWYDPETKRWTGHHSLLHTDTPSAEVTHWMPLPEPPKDEQP